MIITIRETRSLFCSVRDRIKKKKEKEKNNTTSNISRH